MSVRVEKSGLVTTVVLHRPEARNAVDRATADALLAACRALDLILPGRPVGAAEALAIGLTNRTVANGTARAAAEELARQIAAFPQLCLRADRRSAYEQHDLPLADALAHELELGKVPLVH